MSNRENGDLTKNLTNTNTNKYKYKPGFLFSSVLFTIFSSFLSVFRRRGIQVSPCSVQGKMLLPNKLYEIHVLYRIRCLQQGDSQLESRYDLACLLRMLNMVSIVTKIDIQILCLLSQLSCLFSTELLCGRKRMRRWVEKGWKYPSAVLHMLCHLGAC